MTATLTEDIEVIQRRPIPGKISDRQVSTGLPHRSCQFAVVHKIYKGLGEGRGFA